MGLGEECRPHVDTTKLAIFSKTQSSGLFYRPCKCNFTILRLSKLNLMSVANILIDADEMQLYCLNLPKTCEYGSNCGCSKSQMVKC